MQASNAVVRQRQGQQPRNAVPNRSRQTWGCYVLNAATSARWPPTCKSPRKRCAVDLQQHHFPQSRRGAAIVMVMICLLLVSMLGASLLKLALSERKQTIRQYHQTQADWLAESAADRAVARLLSGPEYTGETWEISAADIGDGKSGRAVIEVVSPESPATDQRVEVRKQVDIVVDYPDDEVNRVRIRRTFIIDLPQE